MPRRVFSLIISLFCILTGFAHAQDIEPDPESTQPTTESTTIPAEMPPGIPLAEIALQAESTQSTLRAIETMLENDRVVEETAGRFKTLAIEIDARYVESTRLLSPSPSIDTLRSLDADWRTFGEQINRWNQDLSTRLDELNKNQWQLYERQQSWNETLYNASITATGPDAVERINSMLENIWRLQGAVSARWHEVLTLQGELASKGVLVAYARDAVQQAYDRAIDQLLVPDSPPVWTARAQHQGGQNLTEQSQNSLEAQAKTVRTYTDRHRESFITHALVIGLMAGVLFWMRKRSRSWAEHEPELTDVARVFELPILTAVAASFLLWGFLYPQAPRLLNAMLGAAMLIPTVIVLRRLVDRALIPLLYALIVLNLLGFILSITASMPVLTRHILLGTTFAAALFMLWYFTCLGRLSNSTGKIRRYRFQLRTLVFAALSLSLASTLANTFGYVSLAKLLANGLMTSAYAAIILNAAVHVIEALAQGFLRIEIINRLKMVRDQRAVIVRWVMRLANWSAIIGWIIITLDGFALRGYAHEMLRKILNAQFGYQSFQLTIGGILAFILTVTSALLLSRLIRFVLQEDIYPRMRMARGVPYAISTLLHYVILFTGFLMAVAALGYDMTKFTILAGAFGVGLGFGMQNVVNNFVSGLILLFERPVQVGDVIEMDNVSGVVSRIGIRASVVRTPNAAEVIVPNGLLIANRFTNWTLSNRKRGIDLTISVARDADPKHVINLLVEIAKQNQLTSRTPVPQAYFADFVPNGMKFELRVWADHFEDWNNLRSELALAISERFEKEGLRIL